MSESFTYTAEHRPQDQKYRVNVFYGHVEMRSWLERDGDTLIGMGESKWIDRQGRVVKVKRGPTGSVMHFSTPQPKKPWWRLWK